jgi:hypothetical protein
MSNLETKIRQLLESKKAAGVLNEKTTESGLNAPDEAQHHQGSSQKPQYDEINPGYQSQARRNLDKYQDSTKQDDTLKKGPAEAQAKQGSSEDADYTDTVPFDTENDIGKDGSLKTGADEPQHMQGNSRKPAYTEVNPFQPYVTGNAQEPVAFTKEEKENMAAYEKSAADKKADKKAKEASMKESLRKDIDTVFAGDTNLSEEFKEQASLIFETAVIARVNNEVEAIQAELTEQAIADFEELKEGLIEKIDSYLNYVTEQWMKDNEVEVEQGLRTEVAEDFMLGLKNLFQEHYFEVPADKIDVLEDITAKVDDVTARLDETIAVNIELQTELDDIKRERIIEQACRDLTSTDAEKMSKLLEGVEFDNDKLFTEKVRVVKENYFPGNTPASPEKTLEEQVSYGNDADKKAVPAHMKSYVDALSRTAKVKHLG